MSKAGWECQDWGRVNGGGHQWSREHLQDVRIARRRVAVAIRSMQSRYMEEAST